MSSAHSGVFRACAATVLLLGLPGCETLTAVADHDPAFSFAGYDTFSWISEHPMVSSAPGVSPFAEERIMAAITDTLRTKRIRYVTDATQADFVMAFSVGARQSVAVTSSTYPVAYRGAYRWGGAYYQSVDVRTYTHGRLAVDVFDVREHRPVWHGYATGNVASDDPLKRRQLIKDAVAKILESFPPGAGS